MIDENKDYVTKSELIVTVKIFSECNDRNRVAAKQTGSETQERGR